MTTYITEDGDTAIEMSNGPDIILPPGITEPWQIGLGEAPAAIVSVGRDGYANVDFPILERFTESNRPAAEKRIVAWLPQVLRNLADAIETGQVES